MVAVDFVTQSAALIAGDAAGTVAWADSVDQSR